tara:strand:+ start:6661 stop:7458 length:798 start_codon:yes stop_codon:yes gene_type:complete
MRFFCAVVSVIVFFNPPPVATQGIGLPNQTREKPVEISADEGIEWQQKRQAYIARGNASAKQGDTTVYADTLTAWYKKVKKGQSQIFRIDADTNVRIKTPLQTAIGDKGVYLIEKGMLILTGNPKLITETDIISARDSLEFWENKNVAVARGNAIAQRGERRLRADILTAHLRKNENGDNEIHIVEAFKNVVVSSENEIVRAKRGIYNVMTGIIQVHDDVRITKDDDQLNGSSGEVNLNTGISKLTGKRGERVQGLIKSKKVNKN